MINKLIATEDIEYLTQQSQSQINMIIAEMLELIMDLFGLW